MAEGYSIFDKLPKSTLGLAETILSPTTAALSPMSITNTQTEPTGIGKKLPEGVVEDFPIVNLLGGYGPEGFERPPILGRSGRYLSPEPALTMDPSKVEIEYGDPFLGAQAITKRRRIVENPELLTPIISVKDANLADTI